MSYNQLEENDTAWCLHKIAESLNKRVILPKTVHPYVFANVSWDDIDQLEETLSGRGTSHRVNGIIVQPRVFGPHLPCNDPPQMTKKKKTKRRSINTEAETLDSYISGQRVGPGCLFLPGAASGQNGDSTLDQRQNLKETPN